MASFVFFSACLVFFTAANWWINSSTLTAQKPTYSLGTNDERRTIFLFEDGYLVDATNTAKALLKDIGQPSNLDDWAHFKSAVTDDFADLDAHAETAVSLGHSTLKSHRDERLSLNFEAIHTLIRVELQGTSVTQKTSADRTLSAPFLVWEENEAGEIVWANAAYLKRCEHIETWPLPKLLDTTGLKQKPSGSQQRISQVHNQKLVEWYDVSHEVLEAGFRFYATPADQVVEAEAKLDQFRQSMAKTFAALSCGLALFDRDDRLTVFNPALADKYALPIDFLLRRPSLDMFLHKLRELRLTPANTRFEDWATALTPNEKNAVATTSWTTTKGRKLTAAVMPHAEGSRVISIEETPDMSEVIQALQAENIALKEALDLIPEPTCIIDQGKKVCAANSAFRVQWEDKLNYPISAATGIGKRAKHTDKWDQVRAALNKPMSVHHWKSQLALEGNNSVALNIDRKASGHMLVQFSERPSDTSAVENTSMAAL